MNAQESQTEVVFSYTQASAMLPLLRLIIADISYTHRDLTERRSQMHRIARQRENLKRTSNLDVVYSDEIQESRADLKAEEAQLGILIEELEGLGVLLESANDGVVAFPALMDNRPAFLCWQMGSTDISAWHWPGETYADRKTLTDQQRL